MNETEILERMRLVSLAQEMLDEKISFFEGAAQLLVIINRLSDISDTDPDFNAFRIIRSETDHLPLKAQWPLWNSTAIAALESEFKQTEEWAKSFAPQACRNIIARFSIRD